MGVLLDAGVVAAHFRVTRATLILLALLMLWVEIHLGLFLSVEQISKVSLFRECMKDVHFALLINFHLIDGLLQLADRDLILVFKLHILFLQLGHVGQV